MELQVIGEAVYSLVLALLSLGALLAYLRPRRKLSISLATVCSALLLVVIGIATRISFTTTIASWLPVLSVSFTSIHGVFAITSILAILVAILASRSTADTTEYSLALVTLIGLIGFFTTNSLFWMLVYWELTVLPVFYTGYQEGSRRGALMFLAYTQVSGLLLLSSLAILYLYQGTALLPIAAKLGGWRYEFFIALYLLAMIMKTPLFPLHSWLPPFYSETAPTASIESVILTKMGLYGLVLARLYNIYQGYTWLSVIALIGSVYSITIALKWVREHGYKTAAGYISIAHMGLAAAPLLSPGSGIAAIQAALVFTVAHTFSISALLLGAETLGSDPRIIAVASILGLPVPGLATFAAEFSTLYALITTTYYEYLVLLAAATSLISITALSWIVFNSANRPSIDNHGESVLMRHRAALLIAIVVLIVTGIAPHILETL